MSTQVSKQLVLVFILDNYEIVENRQCADNMYGGYNLLSLAKFYCYSDENCLGVFDPYCNSTGPFFLCPVVFETKVSRTSCIQRKQEYSGKYC